MHQTIVQYQIEAWPNVLCGILITLIGAALAYKLLKIVNKQCSMSNRCHFALELSRNQLQIIVPVATLPGNPLDYKLVAGEFVTNIAVIGYVKPHIDISANNIKLVNKITKLETVIPDKVRIPIMTGLLLRKVFLKEFNCTAIWIKASNRYYVQTE